LTPSVRAMEIRSRGQSGLEPRRWNSSGRLLGTSPKQSSKPTSAHTVPTNGSRISQLSDRVLEINCVCPFEVASNQYSARARSGQHHPVHVLRDLAQSLQFE
jgi:hypothetical protein